MDPFLKKQGILGFAVEDVQSGQKYLSATITMKNKATHSWEWLRSDVRGYRKVADAFRGTARGRPARRAAAFAAAERYLRATSGDNLDFGTPLAGRSDAVRHGAGGELAGVGEG